MFLLINESGRGSEKKSSFQILYVNPWALWSAFSESVFTRSFGWRHASEKMKFHKTVKDEHLQRHKKSCCRIHKLGPADICTFAFDKDSYIIMKKDDIHKRYPDYLLKLMLRSIRVASAGAGAIDHDNSGVSSHLSSQQPQRYKTWHLDEGMAESFCHSCFSYLSLKK